MNSSDMQGFMADEFSIERDDYIIFTYLIETPLDPYEAAVELARESSTAQWKRPNVHEDFRAKHGAKVIELEKIEDSTASSFGIGAGGAYRRVRVRIAHPHINFGARIPNLLTVACGEGAFYCRGITAIKLLDIEFPDSYLSNFQGPRFGTRGLRQLLDVPERPLFFGVVKPNIGLDPTSFAALAGEAWKGGLDAAKDDEMLGDTEYSPFARRMELLGHAMKEAEDFTGEKKMFIANITDEVDQMMALHDIAVQNGINAVMINVMAVGLSAVRAFRKKASVPVVAHFDCIAPMSRHPNFGVATTVITKLERLCGCDAIIMPGFAPRMQTSEEEIIANVAECTKLMGGIKSSLPVPGGSDSACTLPLVYEKLRTLDFAMVPGRGVFGHPTGPRAGAMSLRQAWDAIVGKVDINAYAKDHLELKEAIEEFGSAPETQSTVRVAESGGSLTRGFTGVPLFTGSRQ